MDGRNETFAGEAMPFADAPPLRFAMRELRALARRPGFWMGFAALIAVLAIAGPFGTAGILTLPQRALYWAVIGTATGFAGMGACFAASAWAARAGAPEWLGALAGGFAAGPVVTGVVWVLNVAWLDAVLGTRTVPLGEMAPHLAANTAVTIAIAVLWTVIERAGERRSIVPHPGSHEAPHPASPEVLLSRLPEGACGPVRRLAMQDHYVEVFTTRGRGLVLMRMADAVAALEGAGLRVHRSHWVSPRHVAGVAGPR